MTWASLAVLRVDQSNQVPFETATDSEGVLEAGPVKVSRCISPFTEESCFRVAVPRLDRSREVDDSWIKSCLVDRTHLFERVDRRGGSHHVHGGVELLRQEKHVAVQHGIECILIVESFRVIPLPLERLTTDLATSPHSQGHQENT